MSELYQQLLYKLKTDLLEEWRSARANADAALKLQGNSNTTLLALRRLNGEVEGEYPEVLRNVVPPLTNRVRRHTTAPERFVPPPEKQLLKRKARPRDK